MAIKQSKAADGSSIKEENINKNSKSRTRRWRRDYSIMYFGAKKNIKTASSVNSSPFAAKP